MGDARQETSAVHRLLRAEPGELKPLILSAAFFFCVLFGYFLIRPVREAMGVERGMDELRSLFIWTAGISLLVAMAFGGLVHRFDRRRFIAIGFRAVMLCLLAFAALRVGFGEEIRAQTGRVFYVWLSVINMFLTSIFWAFMADTWTLAQGKRLFPAIGVGGTLGAIAGSSVPWTMSDRIAERIESSSLSVSPSAGSAAVLMLLAALVFELAVRFMLAIDRQQAASANAPETSTGSRSLDGVGLIDGIAFVARSPYLLGVGLYIALIAVSSTLIYFTQARLVTDAEEELVRRVALFGSLDMLAQVFTLIVQLFLTGRIIRWIGIGGTLGVLPVVTLVGFAALWLVSGREGVEPWQVFAVFAVFQALHRASRYAVARPSRETLFSVLSRDEKYKAKTVVDMFVYRGGDVAGARLDAYLASTAAVTLGSITLAVAPLAAIWITLGLSLAWAQARRHARNETAAPLAGTPASEGNPA